MAEDIKLAARVVEVNCGKPVELMRVVGLPQQGQRTSLKPDFTRKLMFKQKSERMSGCAVIVTPGNNQLIGFERDGISRQSRWIFGQQVFTRIKLFGSTHQRHELRMTQPYIGIGAMLTIHPVNQ